MSAWKKVLDQTHKAERVRLSKVLEGVSPSNTTIKELKRLSGLGNVTLNRIQRAYPNIPYER